MPGCTINIFLHQSSLRDSCCWNSLGMTRVTRTQDYRWRTPSPALDKCSGRHPSQLFFPFREGERFLKVLSIRPSRALLTPTSYPGHLWLLGRPEPSTWPWPSPSFVSRTERGRQHALARVHCMRAKTSVRGKLTAKSVVRIRQGTSLGTDCMAHLGERHCQTSNYWAVRLVPGTAFWNKREIYGKRIISARSLMLNRFVTPKVPLNATLGLNKTHRNVELRELAR